MVRSTLDFPVMRLVIATLLACFLSLSTASAEHREVRVGIYENPPKVFKDDKGRPTGLLIDLLESIAREAEWTLIFESCRWQECLDGLRSGKIDLLPDVAFSAERALDFDFHPTPALISWSQIYRREDGRILNYLDLQDKRIAVLGGSIQESFLSEVLKNFSVEHLMVKTDSVDQAFKAVLAGQADVAVASHFYGDHYAASHGLVETPIIFSPSRLHFATAKGQNQELLSEIETRLHRWQADNDSEYFRIQKKWRWPNASNALPAYVWWSLAALLCMLGGVIFFNRWLRREVAKQVLSLASKEERFRSVFDNISEAIFVHDRSSGKLLQVNRRMCEMYGCSENDALLAQASKFSTNIPPYSQKESSEWLRKAVEEGPQVFEWQARRFDTGQAFWVEVSLRAISLAGQECILAVIRDIGERKAVEQELTGYRENLEHMVAQRTFELETARAEALTLARVKSEFLANMSHEIRTPLNGILGFAHLGQERATDEKLRHMFVRIVESGKLLQRVIDDILDYSKIDAGKLRIEALAFDPRELVASTLEMVRDKAESKGLQLYFEPDIPTHQCVGDALRFQQVLLNLLSNAIKFTESGSVRVSLSHGPGELQCRVQDSGIGIDQETLGRLFRPFEQADNSTTRRFGGTGLGLAISARLVELMGGRIEVDSHPAQGSCFTVHLPCHHGAPVAPPRPLASSESVAPSTLQGLRVLVVEDDVTNRLVLSEMLRAFGVQVDLAEDGQIAVDRVLVSGAAAYDLVLMDVMMPVMDGYTACRRLREIDPALPVVGQTALALDDERQACLAAGMLARITKPIDPDTLFAVIKRHARRRRVDQPADFSA
jgi:PAS domain S-box-containing protein